MIVRELIATLGLKVDVPGFKAVDRLFDGIADQVNKAGEKLKSLSGWAGAGAAAVATGIGAVVRSVVSEITDAESHLTKLSGQLGMPVRNLQSWGHAAAASGASLDDFAGAARGLASQMQAASMGSADATMALAKLVPGKSKKDLKDVDKLFEDIAERVKKMPEGLETTNLVSSVLGDSGVSLLPLFRKGRDGIRELREEVRAFGAEFSTVDLEGAKAYKKELSRLDLVVLGLKQSVAGPLQQAFAAASKQFNDWVKSLKGSGVRDARSGFDQFAKLTDALTHAMQLLYKAAVLVAQNIDLIVIGLGAIVATGITFWIAGLVTSLVTGGGLALLAWLPLVAFFAVLFLAVDDVVTLLQGGKSIIGEFFPGMAAKIREIYDLVQKGDFAKAWQTAGNAVKQWLNDHFFDWFARRWDEIVEGIKNLPRRLADATFGMGDEAKFKRLVDQKNYEKKRESEPLTEAESYSNPAYQILRHMTQLASGGGPPGTGSPTSMAPVPAAAYAPSPLGPWSRETTQTRANAPAQVTINQTITGVPDEILAKQATKRMFAEAAEETFGVLER